MRKIKPEDSVKHDVHEINNSTQLIHLAFSPEQESRARQTGGSLIEGASESGVILNEFDGSTRARSFSEILV